MIITARFETILGIMTAAATDEGICMLEFADDKTPDLQYRFLEKSFRTKVQEGENCHLDLLKNQLNEYFSGSRKDFSLPLVTSGTEFQRSVWKELMNIKYGTTRSYLEQSEALGVPASVRAVANANGINRIAILIPCHRVIGSNGKLTGYRGGLGRKKWLLDHEKSFSGQSFVLSMF